MISGIRSFRRDFTLVFAATLTLAVSIAANTTLFSVANSILIRPLPYPGSDRIDWISERSGPNRDDVAVAPDYYRLRDWNHVYEAVAAFNPIAVHRTGVERPEQMDAALVSPSFFRVMGAEPMMGRYLAADEQGSKAPPVVVVSYTFWRDRLGSDTNAIGRTVALDRLPRTIIGVMPQGFDFPRGAQLWLPLELDEANQRPIVATRPIYTVSLIARRRPEVSQKAVDEDLTRLSSMIRPEYRVFPTKFRWDLEIGASPLQQHMTGQLRPVLLMLGGAAGLLLLIACVNLANLLLARAGAQRREIAVRLALGASPGLIVRQMLTQSLALALPGGLAGIALSWLAVRLLNLTRPSILARYPPISIDVAVLAFTLVLTVAASLLFGLAPALSAGAIRVHEALKTAGRAYSGGRGAARLRKLLLVAELGVSLVLLIGAGLLARTFLNLAHTELGFRSDHLLTFRVNPIGPLDRDYSKFYLAVLDRLQQLPMVQSAALLSDVPLSPGDFYMSGRVRVADHPMVPFLERPMINNTLVSPDFFRTLRIPVINGRIFDPHDFPQVPMTNYGFASSAPVVVNEAFVRRLFPGESPLGRRVVFGPDRNPATWTIVGVVGNIRGGALGADPPAMVYRCTCEAGFRVRAAFALRTAGDPQALIHAAEAQVHAVDPDVPIYDVKTMDQRRAAAIAPEQFQLGVLGGFALIAILLAATGVYGVVSYLVTNRTREIGIRIAVGAKPADMVAMVAGETLRLVLVAIGLGLGGAWVLTRYLRSMLYGVTELDTITFLITPAVLFAVVLIACWAPVRYAAGIDPVIALRED